MFRSETQSNVTRRCLEARHGKLNAEIKRLQERVETAHHAVRVLREKLHKERAANAVLVARLMEVESPLPPRGEPIEMRDRFDAVHLGTDAVRDHESLRELVEALYRIALSRGASWAGLPLQGEPPADGRPARWHEFLTGKIVGRTLTGEDDRVIAREGERINDEMLQAAVKAGLLFELIIPMRLPEVDPDL